MRAASYNPHLGATRQGLKWVALERKWPGGLGVDVMTDHLNVGWPNHSRKRLTANYLLRLLSDGNGFRCLNDCRRSRSLA